MSEQRQGADAGIRGAERRTGEDRRKNARLKKKKKSWTRKQPRTLWSRTEARARFSDLHSLSIPPLPFSFYPPPPPTPPPPPPPPPSLTRPSWAQLESTHLPLLLLPGRIQEQVPVPVILLLHVVRRTTGLLVIGSVIIYHVSKKEKPECATE